MKSKKTSEKPTDSAGPAGGAGPLRFGVYAPLKNASDFFHRAKRNVLDGAPPVSDAQCVQDLLRVGMAADQHGFDALWLPERHGDAAAMGAAPLQLLLHLATLTKSIELGALLGASLMEAPLRVAEAIAMADILLQGRRLCLGALTDVPYHEVSGTPEPETLDARLAEALELLEVLLTQEWASFDGTHYSISEASVRPMPRNRFEPGAARLWGAGVPDSERFRVSTGLARDKEAVARPGDAIFVPIFCNDDPEICERAKGWWIQEFDSEVWHSGIFSHPATRHISRTASPREVSQLVSDTFSDAEGMLISGSPDACRARISELTDKACCQEVIFQVHFGLMPIELAEASLALLAESLDRATPQPADGGR
ncbi:LLM class flavin-dependent oxidoreductase [Marinovum sp.]|uniref:LLM class flavin-dependent oxidoreductase n=1 Tax=Marinovum sp. TaxID=2024839 RepID=UPI003A9091EF